VEFLAPASWDEALALRAARSDALVVAGGTDVMVDINFGRVRPAALLDLSAVLTSRPSRRGSQPPAGSQRVESPVADISPFADIPPGDVTGWQPAADRRRVWLGAGVRWAELVGELAQWLPGLALAARTVGSPQIRHRATLAGNLGSASPAGDAHPVLLATGATVVAESVRGMRDIPVAAFFTGPKHHALAPDELIRGLWIPAADGPQQFAKVGQRNAMVIAIVSFALALHLPERTVGTGIGSAGPTPLPAAHAASWLAGELSAANAWASRTPLPDSLVHRFGELVAAEATPIDDLRSPKEYRKHALAVLARRTLIAAWATRTSQSEVA